MSRKGAVRIFLLLALIALAGMLFTACITVEDGKGGKLLTASLAQSIDKQLGPIDTPTEPSPVNDDNGSHIANNLEGNVDLSMVTMFVRLFVDNPFHWGPFLYNPAHRGMLHEFEGFGTLGNEHAVDNGPCGQDLDMNGFPDYCDLCLDKCRDIECNQITDKEFKIKYSDCRWQDPFLYTSTFNPDFTMSFAYWTIYGTATYHYGTASIDEQIVEIDYDNMEFELHDYISGWAQANRNLPNSWYRIKGDELIYRVLTPAGLPAPGTTGALDGMIISNLNMDLDNDNTFDGDDNDLNEPQAKYKFRIAFDYEDGLLFLNGKDVVIPDLDNTIQVAPGAFVFRMYDRNFPFQDGLLHAGCTVVVNNVDDLLRTYDIYGTGTGNYGYLTTCEDLDSEIGVPY